MFIGLYFFILICWIIEYKTKKKWSFNFAWLVLTLVLVMRYGQGNDYFSYYELYTYGDWHSEAVWVLLTNIFNKINLPFEVFIAFISLFMMCGTFRGIKRFVPNRYQSFGLLMLYPTIYFTDFFNTLRMGVVISFFIGFMVDWLIEKKYFRYVISAIVMSGIHSLSLLLLPIVLISYIRKEILELWLVVSTIGGLVMYFLPVSFFSFISIGSFQYYVVERHIAIFALMEKLFLVLLIYFLQKGVQFNNDDNYIGRILIYTMSMCMLFIGWQLVTSRIFQLIGCIAFLQIPNLVSRHNNIYNKRIVIILLLAYCLLIIVKNINIYLFYMGLEQYTVLNCPYFTVFDKKMAIDVLRIQMN